MMILKVMCGTAQTGFDSPFIIYSVAQENGMA